MRGKQAKKRKAEKDILYDSPLVTRLVNQVMMGGKKSIAERAVYGALGRLDDDRVAALKALEGAMRNISPEQEVRSRRVGGATYQVPTPVTRSRATTLAVRWLVRAARKRKGVPMEKKLFAELSAAAKGEGEAVAKKQDVHRMADANRAFAHFRW